MTVAKLRRFSPEEILRFLAAIDRHLVHEATVVLVGGSAMAVGYGVEVTTTDVDTLNNVSALTTAVQEARSETGLDIPFGQAGVADAPHGYEERLKREMPELKKLEVWVLEKHDLALSKIVRGYEHDEQHVVALHGIDPLDLDTLINRFIGEMGHVIGEPRRIELNFLECVERLFGELARVTAERRIHAGRDQG
jgi:hypothetical protein